MQTLNNSTHFTVLWTQRQAPRENVATIVLGEDCVNVQVLSGQAEVLGHRQEKAMLYQTMLSCNESRYGVTLKPQKKRNK